MAFNNAQHVVTLEAGANYATKQFFFVSMSSDGQIDPTGDGAAAIGVLLNDPAAQGRAAEVCIGGLTRVECGTAGVTAGDDIASDASGNAVPAATGDVILGTALETGADGEVISIIFQPRNAAA
ncbi:MAG: hypothetical protein AMJ69_10785 [Gammaproteobacteria bacterium SG8_47]|jgi:hypothetical protein|nr:MAG: hypothetical protein AMJ69_10785 [Gammaproteobacteria bacterium SG8_47]